MEDSGSDGTQQVLLTSLGPREDRSEAEASWMRRRNLVSGGRTFQAERMGETESVGGKRLGKFRKCDGAMAGTWMVP